MTPRLASWADCRCGAPGTEIVVCWGGWLLETCAECARALCDPYLIRETDHRTANTGKVNP